MGIEKQITSEKRKMSYLEKFVCEQKLTSCEAETSTPKETCMQQSVSSHERAFYNFLTIMKLSFEFQPKAKFRYEHDGQEYFLFPNFKIGENFYEITDEHWYEQMQIENTKENAELKCIDENNIKLITKCDVLAFINTVYGKSLSKGSIIQKCVNTKFPGTAKWPANHPIWDSFLPGRISPKEAWTKPNMIEKAVNNMIKIINDCLRDSKETRFCERHIDALLNGCYERLVLNRFTIAKIAPKVTALDETVLYKIIEKSGLDLSNGVYCPMAGFGGIVRGATRWFREHVLLPNIEAYDINKYFCDWYGWEQRDVLAQTITTDKTVIVCPPFGKKYEHWKGTPDDMSDIGFFEWTELIRKHIKAPQYIFIGPENTKGKNVCGLFKRTVGVAYYPISKLDEMKEKGCAL